MTSPAPPGLLEVSGLTVGFGGVRALDGVSLRVPEGRIVGLIGPNGAGKTTLFDCVSGFVRPSTGGVRLFGQDVTDDPPDRRARRGVARTFQRLSLFGSLTVLENLLVASPTEGLGRALVTDVLSLPRGERQRREAVRFARDLLTLGGVRQHEDTRAGDLPIGLARIVELLRALCTKPRLLLLDEPTSGLDTAESATVSELLLRIRDERAVGLLLVEHDMDVALGVSDRVHVLDFGKTIAEGTPAEIRRDPDVRAAYLGEEASGAAAAGG